MRYSISKRVKTLSISNSISKVQDKIEVQIRVDKEPKISFEEFEKDGIHFVEWGNKDLENLLHNYGYNYIIIMDLVMIWKSIIKI